MHEKDVQQHLSSKEMQFKAKVRYNYIPSRMAKIKKLGLSNVGDQIVFSCLGVGSVEWCKRFEKLLARFLYSYTYTCHMIQQSHS